MLYRVCVSAKKQNIIFNFNYVLFTEDIELAKRSIYNKLSFYDYQDIIFSNIKEIHKEGYGCWREDGPLFYDILHCNVTTKEAIESGIAFNFYSHDYYVDDEKEFINV